MTLQELENGVLEHFNYRTDDGDSTVRLRVRRHLNEWHRRILTMAGLDRLREGTDSFASVASTATVHLGYGVARLLRVYETTNDQTLAIRDSDWYRRTQPDAASSTGTPTDVVLIGRVAAVSSPGTTGLWAVSSSASDTTVKITVRSLRGSQIPWNGTATLTGTTRVALGSYTDHVDVRGVLLSHAAVGVVSLYNAATAGTELAQIPVGRTMSRYTRLALWPTPASIITYFMDYERTLDDLSVATDEPWLPEDFHYLLGLGARVNEYEKQEDARLARADQTLTDGLRRLLAWTMNDRGRVYVPGEMPSGSDRSRLGPWFPRGS